MLRCTKCSEEYEEREVRYLCDCGAVLEVVRKYKKPRMRGVGLQKFKEVLPVRQGVVTLGEGFTPLYDAQHLEPELGVKKLWLKFEGTNPTGSFKDRGSCVVATKALEYGFRRTCVASTGNMAASVAAYSAEAGLGCSVFVPDKTPPGKLAQAAAYNAKIHRVRGTFSDCVGRAMEASGRGHYLAMTGLNPYYLEGEKTIAYELAMVRPDVVVVPCGTGGLISAVWKGFREVGLKPRMVGVQAAGCAPIVKAWEKNTEQIRPVEKAETVASAILVKTPFNGHTAVRAMRESKGFGVKVSDVHIHRAIRQLGEEGVFAEPAAALPLAALKKLLAHNSVKGTEKIVLLITGHGLKQPV